MVAGETDLDGQDQGCHGQDSRGRRSHRPSAEAAITHEIGVALLDAQRAGLKPAQILQSQGHGQGRQGRQTRAA